MIIITVFDRSMLVFDRIDTHLFRAFVAAAESGNFTLAATRAGMTQSGVSQHIARLEEQLGVKLFERINKKVLLTSEGKEFKAFIESYSDTLDSFVDRVSATKAQVIGPVRYAMPASCLKTPHFSMLLNKRRQFSQVDLDVHIAANEEIFELLIDGKIDFGFVTKKSLNPAVSHQLFAYEEYVLAGNDKNQLNQINGKTLEEATFINYEGMDVLLELWRQNYFPKKRNFNIHSMKKMGQINHLDGAITMVTHGVGMGVFPQHCIQPLLDSKKLFAYNLPGKSNPIGEIFIVTRLNQVQPKRVIQVLNTFWEMKKI